MDQDILDEVRRVMDRIPQKTYYRIGEVSRITGLKAYVLRFWESEFRPVAPPKSKSGQRMYRRSEIRALLIVKRLLYGERFTIPGARRRLQELLREGGEPGSAARATRGSLLGAVRGELEEIRQILEA
jgi:DNA-binding transcriptional MerR regulator